MALTKEQVMNLRYRDAVHLIRWRYKDGKKVIITKENTFFIEFLENGKASFRSLTNRPKNCWMELYGVKWSLEPCKNSYEENIEE